MLPLTAGLIPINVSRDKPMTLHVFNTLLLDITVRTSRLAFFKYGVRSELLQTWSTRSSSYFFVSHLSPPSPAIPNTLRNPSDLRVTSVTVFPREILHTAGRGLTTFLYF